MCVCVCVCVCTIIAPFIFTALVRVVKVGESISSPLQIDCVSINHAHIIDALYTYTCIVSKFSSLSYIAVYYSVTTFPLHM